MSAALDHLKRQIQQMEGGAARARRHPPTGVSWLDELVGGLPVPGLVELSGPAAGGGVGLAMDVAAQCIRRGRPVAWIDAARSFSPAAAVERQIALDALVWIRPGVTQLAWAVEQVLRSGCFGLVVLTEPPPCKVGQRWHHAAELGGSLCLVVRRLALHDLPVDLRLSFEGDAQVRVTRDRFGRRCVGGRL